MPEPWHRGLTSLRYRSISTLFTKEGSFGNPVGCLRPTFNLFVFFGDADDLCGKFLTDLAWPDWAVARRPAKALDCGLSVDGTDLGLGFANVSRQAQSPSVN